MDGRAISLADVLEAERRLDTGAPLVTALCTVTKPVERKGEIIRIGLIKFPRLEKSSDDEDNPLFHSDKKAT